jgi:hypothetical protein
MTPLLRLEAREPTKDCTRLAGCAAIDLYFGMIGRNNDALRSEVAKLAIALESHRAILAEAKRLGIDP